MKNKLHIVVGIVALVATQFVSAQEKDLRKVVFTGAARGLYYGDKIGQEVEDSITIPRMNSGHTLVDLGMNIRPNRNTEIQGMVRVRNDYGGFWGSGVSFDVRQLYIKGVAGGVVRYQLGDINYKLSPYTLSNTQQEIITQGPVVFQQQTRLMNYDNFYAADSSWRQQGAAAEFGLQFAKYVKELQFHTVATRVRTTDFGSINDRLFAGYNVNLVQSSFLELGVNHVTLFDIEGTSRNLSTFHNPVTTGTLLLKKDFSNWKMKVNVEAGTSKTYYENFEGSPQTNGKIFDAKWLAANTSKGLSVEAGWKYVSSDFRSPGAQTKRVNYNYQPTSFGRITNDQVVRNLTAFDLMRESDAYNRQLSSNLMLIQPKYDNITPYGIATPNRQGLTVVAKYVVPSKVLEISATQLMLQETRGEGTLLPRKFMRSEVKAVAHVSQRFGSRDKLFDVTVRFRNDNTSREAEENVRAVDLSTQIFSVGMEYEFWENWDLMLGVQQVKFNGFDYTAVRNNFSEIYNFKEYQTDGNEYMQAAGVRYRFSDKSSLSANLSSFKNTDAFDATQNYSIRQFMLLYQMNF
ncbi:MAG: hypothetical protein RLZZ71_443 [Bacteroidota bacterium]|jgi:hypothetical protein